MIEINTQKIEGNWHSGVALDKHTISSVYLGQDEHGHDRFDTTYTLMGDLLHRLKYNSDKTAAAGIIQTASDYLKEHKAKFDIIVPVPPSGVRALQPVIFLAEGIGSLLGIPVVDCIKTTRPTQQLKGVQDPEERKQLLAGLYTVDPSQTANRKILLFDDLFRSGSTMNAITDVLMGVGRAEVVRAVTVTCTRSNR